MTDLNNPSSEVMCRAKKELEKRLPADVFGALSAVLTADVDVKTLRKAFQDHFEKAKNADK
jgi:hypothetical protein